jgi:hypothetical protein
MDNTRLRQLVWKPEENAKLDFKIEPYKIYEPRPTISSEIDKWRDAREQQWAELTKDIIALTNGNIGTAEETGYLVIGAGDKLKADGKPTLRNVSETVPTQTEILQKVNSYCYPEIPDLQCEKFVVESVNLLVISIPPSPYLHRLLKQLKPPKGDYSPHAVLIRRKDGEKTYVASPVEIEAIENEKNGGTKSLPTWIQLEVDLENERRIPKQKLKKKAWRGYFISLIFLVALLSTFVALLGTSFGPIVLWYHITVSTWYLIALFSIFPIFIYFIKPYIEGGEMKFYYLILSKAKMPAYVGQGSFIRENGEGDYLIYSFTAPCIYPCCNMGKIVIADAPPKEISRIGKKFVGVCSVAGNDHSYHIDNIFVAKPDQFDWSAPNKTNINR